MNPGRFGLAFPQSRLAIEAAAAVHKTRRPDPGIASAHSKLSPTPKGKGLLCKLGGRMTFLHFVFSEKVKLEDNLVLIFFYSLSW